MKYRDHRGSLSESLATTREVNSLEDIVQHINDTYKEFGSEVQEIKFKDVGFDERTGWNTCHVLCRMKGQKNFTVEGMINGQLELT